MTFRWPLLLVSLLAVPVAVWAYAGRQRTIAARRRALADSGMVVTGPAATGRRRHLPFVLQLLALTGLCLALARPEAVLSLPRRTGTVVLVFDVSTSMRADDVAPTRLAAAQAAARAFVEDQPDGVKVGVVAFGSGAQVAAAPSTDHGDALAAIDRLDASGSTATGTGLFTALSAVAGSPIPVTEEQVASGDLSGVDLGFLGSAAVVLLSDGETTTGPDPMAVADLAAGAGIAVTTIGVGSAAGAVLEVDGFQIATSLDEALLQAIADATGGTYRRAVDAESLTDAYAGLDLQWERTGEVVEITAVCCLAAVLLLAVAAAVSTRVLGRVV